MGREEGDGGKDGGRREREGIEEGRNPLPLLPSFLSFPTRNSFTSHGQNILRKPDAATHLHVQKLPTARDDARARVRVYVRCAATCTPQAHM